MDKTGRHGRGDRLGGVMGYIVEICKKNGWVKDAGLIPFATLTEAEEYAKMLYKHGVAARVVDERYRRERKKIRL